jgi:hypothetical protein
MNSCALASLAAASTSAFEGGARTNEDAQEVQRRGAGGFAQVPAWPPWG